MARRVTPGTGTVVLDSEGLSKAAARDERTAAFIKQALAEQGRVVVPAVTLAEVLRGGQRDAAVHHVLNQYELQDITPALGRAADSDIDLLLVRPDGDDDDVWDDQAQALTAEMTRWTGNDTRAIVLDENDVGPGEPVLQDVLAHGLTVAGSRGWLVKRTRPAQVDA